MALENQENRLTELEKRNDLLMTALILALGVMDIEEVGVRTHTLRSVITKAGAINDVVRRMDGFVWPKTAAVDVAKESH